MTTEQQQQMNDDGNALAITIHKLFQDHFEKYPSLREPRVKINVQEDMLKQQFVVSCEVKFESDIKEYFG